MKVLKLAAGAVLTVLACGSWISAHAAERTTWLMHDQICAIPKLVCSSGNCDHDGMGKVDFAKLLPGVPKVMNAAPDYNANGYWHVVLNILEASKSSACGRSGTVRILFEGLGDRWAYYNETLSGYGSATMQLGKATVISQKFSNWKMMVGKYDKITQDADWNKNVLRWALGPIPTDVFLCTPIKMRFRVYITLDKNFVPPTNPDDPVGVQPGGTTPVLEGDLTPARSSRATGQSPTKILLNGSAQNGGAHRLFDIRGKAVTSGSTRPFAVRIRSPR